MSDGIPSMGSWARELLADLFGSELANRIVRFEHHPKRGDVSIRLGEGMPAEPAAVAEGSHLIDAVEVRGGYVNLWLSDAAVDRWRSMDRPWRGLQVAIEHTSMTPVYPINIATARSTILGEQLRRAAETLGATAVGRFWFEETARQRGLATVRTDIADISSEGKADHVVGAAFAAGLGRQRGYGAEWLARATAALADTDVPTDVFDPAGRVLTRAEDEAIARAYDRTMSILGAVDVRFDFQQDVTSSVDMNFVEELLAQSGSDRSLKPESRGELGYAMRNFVYYIRLLADYDAVYTVIPKDQIAKLKDSYDLASRAYEGFNKKLVVHKYGPVRYGDTFDKPSDGIFHTVDSVVDQRAFLSAYRSLVLTRGPQVALVLDGLEVPRRPQTAPNQSRPMVAAALLLDELPSILIEAMDTCRFGKLMHWLERSTSISSQVGLPLRLRFELQTVRSVLSGETGQAPFSIA